MSAQAPVTREMGEPDDVLTELKAHVLGHIDGDWRGVETRPARAGGPDRPTVDALGNVPMTLDYASRLAGHQEVDAVWCATAAAVETTGRGELPGTAVAAHVATERAVHHVNFAGDRWFAWHPAWRDGDLAEAEGGAAAEIMHMSLDEYRDGLDGVTEVGP